MEAVPALGYALLCLTIPETPRWLITHGGQREAGKEIFRSVNLELSDVALTELVDTIEASSGSRDVARAFFTQRLRQHSCWPF